jgi:hypothetical protein
MSGPTIARNYGDVSELVKANQNALFEVNNDGSIRTQNIKEKLANLGNRLLGKFEVRKAEKDARVKEAIVLLFNKTNHSQDSVYAPQRDRILDRFFHPVTIQSRKSVMKDHRPTTPKISPAISAPISLAQEPTVILAAQKLFHETLAYEFDNLAASKKIPNKTDQIEVLAKIIRQDGRRLKLDNLSESINQLQQNLQPLGFTLGTGILKDFDLSKGVVEWAKKAAPNQFSD